MPIVRTMNTFDAADPFAAILGASPAAHAIRVFGARAAAVDASVLLTGESGTGKGILARAIHEASPRRRGPFVAVNCAGVPESLFESEFFGHTRGAFTGALQSRRGLLELADGGTLFLDEIGELPLGMQAKLLTALEDRAFRRVGGERLVRVDCRIVTATAVDLERAVLNRTFRRDLYHRLLVLWYCLPPLRERGGDIDIIAEHCLQACARKYDRHVRGFAPGTLARLRAHPWPGNVRQLAHAIEAALLATDGGLILPAALPQDALSSEAAVAPPSERERLLAVLQRTAGNKTRAAEILGITRTTLRHRLRKCGIEQADHWMHRL